MRAIALAVRLVMLLVGVTARLHAQVNSGGTDLLFPLGARGVSLNSAMVAEAGGEAIWWNPAGLARVAHPEFGIDYFSTFAIESGIGATFLVPAGPVGTFAIAARYFNYGDTPATSTSGEEVGVSSLYSTVLGASFGTSFGDRLSGGVSFRFYRFANPCSGACGNVVSSASNTAAVDVGAQYKLSTTWPLTLGAQVTNLGPSLQIHDQPQADPLPVQLHVGASLTPTRPDWDPALRVRVTAEYVQSVRGLTSSEERLGAEVGYKSGETTVFARGGLIHQSVSSAGSGPTVGFGLQNKRVQLDFARIIESFSTELGKPPTYISIRVGL
jgi:hypothetical protein